MLIIKCRLQSEVQAVESALQTCRQMLQLWKNLYEAAVDRLIVDLAQVLIAQFAGDNILGSKYFRVSNLQQVDSFCTLLMAIVSFNLLK